MSKYEHTSKQAHLTSLIRDIYAESYDVTKAIADRLSHEDVWNLFVEMDKKLQKLQSIQIGSNKKSRERKLFDTQRDYSDFFHWLKQNGVDLSDILDVCFHPDYGHGLIAKKDFTSDELITKIPLELMITNKTALESSVSLLVAQDEMFQKIFSLPLVMLLVVERYKLKSKWGPYINSFPKVLRLPLFWEREQIYKLKGSQLFLEILKQRASIARQYAHTWKLLEHLQHAVVKRESFTYQIFAWAYGTVLSRKNKIPIIGKDDKPVEALSLIPVYDLFNHEDGTEITSVYTLNEECIECRTKRSFKQGEQIFMFYGHRGNNDLLLNSGFCLSENKWDYVQLLLELPAKDKYRERKLEVLRQHNIPDFGLYVIYPITKEHKVPIIPELVQFMRVFAISNDEDMEKIEEAFTEGGINDNNEKKVYTMLQVKLRQRMMEYETTLEHDRALLEDNSISYEEKQIRRALVSEKKIIQDAIDFCKEMKEKI